MDYPRNNNLQKYYELVNDNLNHNGSSRIPFDLKIGDNQTSEGDTNLTGPSQIRRVIYERKKLPREEMKQFKKRALEPGVRRTLRSERKGEVRDTISTLPDKNISKSGVSAREYALRTRHEMNWRIPMHVVWGNKLDSNRF
jgi:hypothetical protein